MKRCKHHILLLLLLLSAFYADAQNKKHDWSIGVNSGLFSYSAILENKLTNPYEYSIGANVTVSRYLNNHFDLTLQGNRTSINFPTNTIFGEPFKYDKTNLYGANFTLKYKFDNGYILKEHMMFAPYFTLGGGAYMTPISNLTYVTPIGLGVTVNLGDRTSLIFESQYNRDFGGSLSYIQHNAGLKIHFGPANKKRLKATRRREKARRYARIKKYREQQRIAQAQRAKKKLDALKAQGAVNTVPTIEEDQDLLLTNQTIALRPEDETKKIEVNMPPSKPKESSITKESNSRPVTIPAVEPAIPVSPGKTSHTEESKPILTNNKPSIPKPNSNRIEVAEESKPDVTVRPPSKPKPVVKPAVAEKPKPVVKPVVAEKPKPVVKPAVVEKPKPVVKPAVAEKPKPVVKPAVAEKPKPAKDIEKVCKNSEIVLSTIGENINFDSDRSRIRSRMHADLNKIITILNECDEYSYVIIAHTDSDGDPEYNKKLAAKRALAIKKYLMDKGVDGARLVTVAYGSSVPIAPNTSSNNKAKNRRIEFRLNRTTFEQ